ncbi:response regulator transcription factor [Butyrivibrio sp. VCD2006]|uniref:response regulator transcription factor n=1 Tax=Butyrivibrio sp. VCD2006 TaxID=1280664 RepID=UPI0004214DAF|nr:response regulator [Butyrivibrio sp. VCD2006]
MRNLKVLLADDEQTIREGFKHLFDWEKHGCSIIGEASDGQEALEKIETLHPDIVIIDISMPVLTGLEVIAKIKKQGLKTAFVIVSGYDDFSYCQEALRLRVEAYLLKPVNFDELSDLVDRLKIKLGEMDMLEDAPASSTDRKLIRDMTDYLNNHLDEEISLKILGEVFYLTPNYISRVFRDELGVNYLSYLTHLRIEKAKELLARTDMGIAEISEAAGFNDYRVFTKVFKRYENVPPTQFRKYMRNNS